jgi:hypothetical protein
MRMDWNRVRGVGVVVLGLAACVLTGGASAGSTRDGFELDRPPFDPGSRLDTCLDQQPAPPAAMRDREVVPGSWTILFYNDADFTNAFNPHDYFFEEMTNTAHVDVVELVDRFNMPALLWTLDEAQNLVYVEGWGEPSMGTGATLRDFVLRGKELCPAERYLLCVYDHGGGWMGSCTDASDNSWLEMHEMNAALVEAGGVDILCFTAPCLMGAVEAAYEVRESVEVYVGSEDLSGYILWYGIMDDVCALLEGAGDAPTSTVGAAIVDLVGGNASFDAWSTMSAVDTGSLAAVGSAIGAVSQTLLDNLAAWYTPVAQARAATWTLGRGGDFRVDEVDLVDLTQQLAAHVGDAGLATQLAQLEAAVETALLASAAGSGHDRCHGLSIDFPDDPIYFSPYYTTMGLDLVADTTWDEFLAAYLAGPPSTVSSEPIAVTLDRLPPGDGAGWLLSLPTSARVTAEVYDLRGRRVRTLVDGAVGAGANRLVWDGRDDAQRRLGAGVYICAVQAGERRLTARTVLVR